MESDLFFPITVTAGTKCLTGLESEPVLQELCSMASPCSSDYMEGTTKREEWASVDIGNPGSPLCHIREH